MEGWRIRCRWSEGRLKRRGRGFTEPAPSVIGASASPPLTKLSHAGASGPVGYNARNTSAALIVLPKISRFALLMLVATLGICVGQTGAPEKSVERAALQRGQDALKSGDMARARAEFEKAVRLAPNDAEAQSALGWVLAQQGETEGAVSHLKAAVKAKPGFIQARVSLA